jgi:predicted O-linked N-acetylglucosamine transferase (SPINDLY family)
MATAADDLARQFDDASQAFRAGHAAQAETLCLNILKSDAHHFNALNLLATLYAQSFRYTDAVGIFERALAVHDKHAPLYNNYGIVLERLGQIENAIAAYDKAVSLQPAYPQAFNNRGFAFSKLRNYDAALASYHRALEIKPDFAEAQMNLGVALNHLGRHDEALAIFKRAFAVMPNNPFLLSLIAQTKMRICDWSDHAALVDQLVRAIEAGTVLATPFSLLALVDNAVLHRRAAEAWMRHNNPENPALGPLLPRQTNPKIKVGYFSMDFREHPVAQLAIELFEHHNTDAFEVTAFSFTEHTGDALQQRLKRAFPQFIDVNAMSDAEVAAFARKMNIDIAVDLAGHTIRSRPGIFSYRAAPLQVSYLGYPGTFGAPYMDYVLADQTVIPETAWPYYTEKVAYLPYSYQANAAWHAIPDPAPPRSQLGLPDDAFVFCCFNNTHKITPDVFDTWMRILKAVPQSVLWLLGDNDVAMRNLRSEAQKRGVDERRIIFALRADRRTYLARQQAADVFLDTLPYNAHTTASDALRYGLPVLTCMGATFAGRVAASLLKTLGVPELITMSLAEYEAKAIALASHPDELKAVRRRLNEAAKTAPLFDPKTFAGYVEDAYRQMMSRYLLSQPPGHLYIRPSLFQSS